VAKIGNGKTPRLEWKTATFTAPHPRSGIPLMLVVVRRYGRKHDYTDYLSNTFRWQPAPVPLPLLGLLLHCLTSGQLIWQDALMPESGIASHKHRGASSYITASPFMYRRVLYPASLTYGMSGVDHNGLSPLSQARRHVLTFHQQGKEASRDEGA
jgi:hypothetical protein